MRALVLFASAAALAACNPYDPSLPPVPFRCGDMDPVCPSGYSCNAANECEIDSGGVDANHTADAGCQDLAEPNDMITTATNGAVFDQLPMIVLESLSLCPMMDTDYFHLNQPLNCGGTGPACPNLDVLVEFEDTTATPTLVIQNATGVTVQPGNCDGSCPSPGRVKAVFNNVPQGQYYVRVTAQTVLSHYKLTIDGTRAL